MTVRSSVRPFTSRRSTPGPRPRSLPGGRARLRGHTRSAAVAVSRSTSPCRTPAKNPSADGSDGVRRTTRAQACRGRSRVADLPHQRGCSFGPRSRRRSRGAPCGSRDDHATPRVARPCRAPRRASGTLLAIRDRDMSMLTGVKPGAADVHEPRRPDSETLNVMWCGPPPWRATNRARKSFWSTAHGSSNSTGMPSPSSVTEPHLHRAKARWTGRPNRIVPPSSPVRNATHGRGVGRGERDVVEVVAVVHERGRLGPVVVDPRFRAGTVPARLARVPTRGPRPAR